MCSFSFLYRYLLQHFRVIDRFPFWKNIGIIMGSHRSYLLCQCNCYFDYYCMPKRTPKRTAQTYSFLSLVIQKDRISIFYYENENSVFFFIYYFFSSSNASIPNTIKSITVLSFSYKSPMEPSDNSVKQEYAKNSSSAVIS